MVPSGQKQPSTRTVLFCEELEGWEGIMRWVCKQLGSRQAGAAGTNSAAQLPGRERPRCPSASSPDRPGLAGGLFCRTTGPVLPVRRATHGCRREAAVRGARVRREDPVLPKMTVLPSPPTLPGTARLSPPCSPELGSGYQLCLARPEAPQPSQTLQPDLLPHANAQPGLHECLATHPGLASGWAECPAEP